MLETIDLSKIYKPKKGAPVKALDNVSIKFPSKGMVFLLGKSGSGKSTLLNLLGGLDKYTSGEIKIKGVSSKSFKQQHFDSYRNTYVGFIFQEYNILEDFSVGANIALAIELQGRKATNEEINYILNEVDLAGYGDRKPNELSGGQKQRVAIARALVKKPEIIMADEPTGALDSNTGKQVFDTLKKLSKERLVLIVSHDREFSELYADRIIELADGKVLSDVEYSRDEVVDTGEKIEFNDGTIDLPMGYMLTEEDRIAINEYIKALNSNDTVSINLKKNTRKSHFKQTDESKIETQDGKSFKLIKSKLPLKNAFKIGASGLKHKKFRLVVTILLCVVSFTLFGLTDTIASYNHFKANVDSIMDANIDYASYSKTYKRYYGSGKNNYDWINIVNGISDEDVQDIKKKTGIEVMGVYSKEDKLSLSNHIKRNADASLVYMPQLAGVVDVTAGLFDKLGYNLVAGKLPTKGSNEVVITEYTFQSFKGNSYIQYSEDKEEPKEVKIEKYSDLLNKELILGDNYGTYKIVGIVDTGFNHERYKPLQNNNLDGGLANELQYMILASELSSLVSYSTHTVMFVSEGTTDKIVELNKTDSKYTAQHGSIELIMRIPYDNGKYYYEDMTNFRYYNSFSDVNKNNIVWFNNGQNSLADDEILVSFEIYMNLLRQEIYSGVDKYPDGDQNTPIMTLKFENGDIYLEIYSKSQIIDYFEQILLFEYVKNHIDEAKTYFENVNPGVDINHVDLRYIAEEYIHFILYYSENPYGQTKDQIYKADLPELLNKLDVKIKNLELNLSINSFSSGISERIDNVKIAGVFINDYSSDQSGKEYYNEYNSTVVLNDKHINNFAVGEGGKYAYALGIMPRNRAGVEKVVRYSLDESKNIRFRLVNPASNGLEMLDRTLEEIAKIFFWVGFAFAVFASVMFSNFIATSISYKKREIGILRAIGSRSNDVFRIFFAESFIIACINFVISFIATGIFANIITNSFKQYTPFMITLLRVGIRQFVVMFAICVFVAFISSLLPIKKIASKSPIDAINNR